jgi:hypothetical protein
MSIIYKVKYNWDWFVTLDNVIFIGIILLLTIAGYTALIYNLVRVSIDEKISQLPLIIMPLMLTIFLLCIWPRSEREIIIYQDRISFTDKRATILLWKKPDVLKFSRIKSVKIRKNSIWINPKNENKLYRIMTAGLTNNEVKTIFSIIKSKVL